MRIRHFGRPMRLPQVNLLTRFRAKSELELGIDFRSIPCLMTHFSDHCPSSGYFIRGMSLKTILWPELTSYWCFKAVRQMKMSHSVSITCPILFCSSWERNSSFLIREKKINRENSEYEGIYQILEKMCKISTKIFLSKNISLKY